jgi:hypothetical protein
MKVAQRLPVGIAVVDYEEPVAGDTGTFGHFVSVVRNLDYCAPPNLPLRRAQLQTPHTNSPSRLFLQLKCCDSMCGLRVSGEFNNE